MRRQSSSVTPPGRRTLVPERHGFRPGAGVSGESLRRELVEFRSQAGQGAIQIAGRPVKPLAVHDPPLQFHSGGAPGVELRGAGAPDDVVVMNQVW